MKNEPIDYLPELLARIQRGSRQDARSSLEQAAQQYPKDPRPLLLLAAELVHAKEIDRAEGTYLLALQRAPDFAIARFQLGLLQFTSARPAAAIATWAPLDLLPETDPLRLFKTGLEALGEDRFEDARRWLLEGIARNTSNAPLNRDMQMVIDRIAELGVLDGGAKGAPEPKPAEQAAEGQAHFLVSAYRGGRN